MSRRRGDSPPPTELERELAFLSSLAERGTLSAYLEAWGERGEPHVACECVLARHLRRRLGLDGEVSHRRTGDPSRLEVLDEHGSPLAALPRPLVKFVAAFDGSQFPELILEGEALEGESSTDGRPPEGPGPLAGEEFAPQAPAGQPPPLPSRPPGHGQE